MTFQGGKGEDPVFIVGSPRSGTTIIGSILDLHPDLKQWFEPYFIWDKYFRLTTNDVRLAQDATPKVIRYIRARFRSYRQKSGCRFVLDKSPRNSLRLEFIRRIFPQARFIHICRDGRDSTLSIYNEWLKRKNQTATLPVKTQSYELQQWSLLLKWLNMQPFLGDRLRALWFESHGHIFNSNMRLSRLRWNGAFGWGPRFREWETAFDRLSLLQFNAMQWQTCVSAILDSWDGIPDASRLVIRYEDFLQDPTGIFKQIASFIGVDDNPGLSATFPDIMKENFNKWKTAFSPAQREEIRPILTPDLMRLGYIKDPQW